MLTNQKDRTNDKGVAQHGRAHNKLHENNKSSIQKLDDEVILFISESIKQSKLNFMVIVSLIIIICAVVISIITKSSVNTAIMGGMGLPLVLVFGFTFISFKQRINKNRYRAEIQEKLIEWYTNNFDIEIFRKKYEDILYLDEGEKGLIILQDIQKELYDKYPSIDEYILEEASSCIYDYIIGKFELSKEDI